MKVKLYPHCWIPSLIDLVWGQNPIAASVVTGCEHPGKMINLTITNLTASVRLKRNSCTNRILCRVVNTCRKQMECKHERLSAIRVVVTAPTNLTIGRPSTQSNGLVSTNFEPCSIPENIPPLLQLKHVKQTRIEKWMNHLLHRKYL